MKNLRISIFLLFLVTQLNVFAAYQLVWEESFDCESLNTTLWNYETGVGANCDGSGNWERQEYTNSTDNIYMENGNLVLKAIYNDHVSQPCNYRTYWTSGRINTKDRFSVKYGKIEARIKLPRNGLGVFPAFWMLGANYDAVGWPSCGEIDIMEQMGVNYSQGGKITPTTLHWNAGGHADYGGSLNIYDRFGTMPADDYFIYGVEWTPDNIRGYVCRGDGSDWTEVMNRDGGSGYGCPDAMKQEFYIILNLAMGGTPVGEFPDNAGDVPFNPTMYIDWIRIYQDKAAYPASSFTDYSGDCGDTPTYPSVSDKDYILLCRESELPCTDEYTDLRYNTGATQFNLWGNMDGANGVTPAEGAESLAFVTNANAVAQNWYGYGIHSGTMYDYSALTDYTLHLKYYTNTAGAFQVQVGDGTYNVTNPTVSTWTDLDVPVSSMGGSYGVSDDINLFGLCQAATPTNGKIVAVDDIYFYKTNRIPDCGCDASAPCNFFESYDITKHMVLNDSWGPIANGVSGEILTNGYRSTINSTSGSGDWKYQFLMKPLSRTTIDAGKTYNFSVYITPNRNVNLVYKVCNGAEDTSWQENMAGTTFTAGVRQQVTFSGVSGATLTDVLFVVGGIGPITAGTTITYEDIVLEEEGCSGSTCSLTAGITGVGEITCATNPTLTVTSNETGLTYKWSNNATTSHLPVVTAGVYSVTVTNGNTCTASASVSVSQNKTAPVITVSKSSDMSCNVRTVTLSVSSGTAGLTYNWSNALGTSSRVTTTTARAYTVTATNPANGCTSTATVSVSDNKETLNVTINGAGQLACANNSLVLTASGMPAGTTYAWSGEGTSSTKMVTTGGGYTVTATYGVCSATNSASVTSDNNVPAIGINKSNDITCSVPNVTLSVTASKAGLSYRWSTGSIQTTAVVSAGGTYTVTATDAGSGCSATETIAVLNKVTTPSVSIVGATPLNCQTREVLLSAETDIENAVYKWNNEVGTSEKLVTSSGAYSVRVEDPTNGCFASVSTEIQEVLDNISPRIDGGTELSCNQSTLTLYVSGMPGGSTYKWSDNSTESTLQVTVSGEYKVTVSYGVCTGSANINISGGTDGAVMEISSSANEITCSNNRVTLTASSVQAGMTYLWSTGATTSTIEVETGDTYSVTGTNQYGCKVIRQKTITDNTSEPNISISSSDIDCMNPTATMSVMSSATTPIYSWSVGGSGETATVNVGGVYSVTVTDNRNGCSAVGSVQVNDNTYELHPTIYGKQDLSCNRRSVNLSVSSTEGGSVVYNWSTGRTGANITVSSAGTYVVTATYGQCVGTASETIESDNETPEIVIVGGELNCRVNKIKLTASVISGMTEGSFSWSSGGQSQVIEIEQTGVYNVEMTSLNGCKATASISVTRNDTKPQVQINGGGTLSCTNPTLNLTATATSASGSTLSYKWSALSQAQLQTVTEAGVYVVSVTDNANGCVGTASVSVSANLDRPNVSIPQPNDITCAQTSALLSANASGVSFKWSDGGETSATKLVTEAGTYSVTVTDVYGCSNVASVLLSEYKTVPTVSIPSVEPLTCIETERTLRPEIESENGITYNWNNGYALTPNYVATSEGVYTLVVMDAVSKCTVSETVSVSMNDTKPTVSITGASELTCDVKTITISAVGNGVRYTWDTGEESATKEVDAVGIYSVTAEGSNGCTNVASVEIVSNNDVPQIGILGVEELTCSRTSVVLTVTGNGTGYTWENGSTTSTLLVTTANTYRVSTKNASGCTAQAEYTVRMNNTVPRVGIVGQTELTCLNSQIVLSVTGDAGSSYSWSTGSQVESLPVMESGVYAVTATGENGCTNTASVSVTENKEADASIVNNSGTSQLTCSVRSIALVAQGGESFVWSTGDMTAAMNATVSGIYTVTVTNSLGCSAVSSVEITEDKTKPMVGIVGVSNLDCYTSQVVLTVTSDKPVTYSWTGGGTESTKSVEVGGTYAVVVTDSNNGCQNSATAEILDNQELGEIVISGNAVLDCEHSSTILTAELTGATFLWSNGAMTSTNEVSTQGTYVVTATVGTCSTTKSIVVTDESTPIVVTLNPSSINAKVGDDVSVEALASGDGLTYVWYKGVEVVGSTQTMTLSSVTDASAGTYRVVVTKGTCSGEASIIVNITQADAPTIIRDPESVTVLEYEEATFTIEAEAGVTYQWYVDGYAEYGATSSSFTIEDITKTNYNGSQVYCVVTKNGVSATSGIAYITVKYALPRIVNIRPDVNIETQVGEDEVTLTVSASGKGLTYTWSEFNTGTTTCVVPTSVAKTYNITISVSNESGVVTASARVVVKAADAPEIFEDVQDVTAIEGESARFEIDAEYGSTLQWYRNGMAQAGETGNVYEITDVNKATHDGNTIYCVVTKNGTSIESRTATLTVKYAAPTGVTITPASPTVKVGSAIITLRANATGNELTYTWSDGTVGREMTFDPSSVGQYTVSVVVTNEGGSATQTAVITVEAADGATILSQPENATVIEGETATFSVRVAETGVTYQWYKDGVAIDGATGSSYTTPVLSKVDDGSRYMCKVNNLGTEVSSNVALLTVKYAAPTNVRITPNNGTIVLGEGSQIFRVEADGEELTYLWSDGTTNQTMEYTPQAVGTYTVSVVVTNEGGSATASTTLTVNAAGGATVLVEPEDQVIMVGENATFTVRVLEVDVTYQWYKGNEAIAGATNDSYTVVNALKLLDGTKYSCKINRLGTIISSREATLTVKYAAPTGVRITPDAASAQVGDGALTFTASAIGGGTYTYEWSDGQTGSTFTYTPTVATTETISVTATGEGGSAVGTVIITINAAGGATIISQPQSAEVTVGDNAVFSIVVEEPGVTYQWYKNGVAIDGATSNTLVLNGVTKVDDGSIIYCEVDNLGTKINSSSATLTVKNVAPRGAVITPQDSELKVGDAAITLTASATGEELSYRWSDGSITSTMSYTPTSKGVYTVSVVISNDGGSVSASTTVEVKYAVPTNVGVLPANPTVQAGGSSVTLTATCVGEGVTYRWSNSSVGSTLVYSSNTVGVETISVTAENESGIASATIEIEVVAAAGATFVTQPQSQTVTEGSTATFSVEVAESGVSYQWYKNGVAIAGATGSTYTTPATVKAEDGSMFYCEVNNLGTRTNSEVVTLTVKYAAPRNIVITPSNPNAKVGDANIILSASAEGGEVSYVWSDGNVSNTTSFTPDTKGSYTLTVSATNEGGTATASVAINVYAADAATIITQPSGKTATVGEEVSFTIVVAESDVTYQWYENGQAIAGATTSVYTFTATKAMDENMYHCVVDNKGTKARSDYAELIVLYAAPQGVSIQLSSSTAKIGDAAISMTASSVGEGVTYNWSVGTLGATATFPTDNGGTYTVSVTATNEGGSASASAVITIEMADAANITLQPQNQTAEEGQMVSFEVACDVADVTYQWYKNNVAIPGATAALYTESNVTKENNNGAVYSCKIDHNGTVIESNRATLTVLYASPTGVIISPVDPVAAKGESAIVLSVTAVGKEVVYTWSTGATGTTCEFATTEVGVYTVSVTATNEGGEDTAEVIVEITAAEEAHIASQTGNQIATEGDDVTFEVEVEETDVTYQWYKNGTAIAGATSSAYTATGVTKANDGDIYTCEIDRLGTVITSRGSKLTVKYAQPSALTISPASPSAKVGDAPLTLTAACTGSDVTYKWSSGEITNTVVFNPNQLGTFVLKVTATNEGGSVSAQVTVVVEEADAAQITAQPMSQTVTVGEDATFSVEASGDELVYQWYKNGIAITGANASSYTATGVTKSNDGEEYHCVIIRRGTLIQTDKAKLTVLNPAPTGVRIMASATVVKVGDEKVRLTASSVGEGVTYTWSIATGNGNVASLETSVKGVYTVSVTATNEGGTASASVEITIEVAAPKSIVVTPEKQSVLKGSTVRFTANAVGDELTYQWYKDNQALTGETASVLTIVVTGSEYGSYMCVASNMNGSVTSNVVTLEIIPGKVSGITSSNENPQEGDNVTYGVVNPEEGVTYTWMLSDGTVVGTGSEIDYTWSTAGIYDMVVVPSNGVSDGESTAKSVRVKPVVDIQIQTYITDPEVGDEIAYFVENPDPEVEYNWTVEGGELIDGQGGDRVKIRWTSVGDKVIHCMPTKNGVEGDGVKAYTTVAEKGSTGGNGGGVAVSEESVVVTVYPNPTSDELHLVLPEEVEVSEIVLYGINGQKVMMMNPSDRDFSLSGLNKGIYILYVRTNVKTFVNQVIVY